MLTEREIQQLIQLRTVYVEGSEFETNISKNKALGNFKTTFK